MSVTVMGKPRASLGRVLEDMGSTLLETLAGSPEPNAPIGNVVIHDPVDLPVIGPGTLVLAVRVTATDEICSLLRTPDVTAVVIRAPYDPGDEVRRAAADAGTVLLGLSPGASWAQVAALLRNLLAVEAVGGSDNETLAGSPAGDLFAIANAISALLDAPITIEDRNSRVLAFSGRQDEADASRVETILGRKVPERFMSYFETNGVFRNLYSSDDPVYIPNIVETELDRVAVRVRAGDEILGSIWAAVRGPLSPERTRALAESSKLVALHVLRARAGADVERRLRSELVATVLEGGPGSGDAASRLGLNASPLCVLALGLPNADSRDPQDEAHLERVSNAFTVHLNAVQPRAVTASIGNVLYGILPTTQGEGQRSDRAVRIAREFLVRLGSRGNACIGVGRTVSDRTGLSRSRRDADRALRVLRAGRSRDRVAQAEDIHVEALLLELGDLALREGTRVTGPVARLAEYDAQHDGTMLPTLEAWLDAFGDVTRAAATMHVHANTFRYRLRRLSAIGDIDLDNPDQRFAAMLQLRLYGALAGHDL